MQKVVFLTYPGIKFARATIYWICVSVLYDLRIEYFSVLIPNIRYLTSQEMIAGLKEQLSMEVQYCAKLGSSSCGLLWSLSKQGLPHSTIHTVSRAMMKGTANKM